MSYSIKDARSILAFVDVSIIRNTTGEYIVKPHLSSGMGYFTDDINDAVYTGIAMANKHGNFEAALKKAEFIKLWNNKQYEGICIYKGVLSYEGSRTMFTFTRKDWRLEFLNNMLCIFPMGKNESCFSILYEDIIGFRELEECDSYINVKI